MPCYDVVLIHPPAHYDFRRKPIFPGPMGPSVEALQYIKVPIGMLSMAEYLDRHGYKVILDNIGDRMVNTIGFDATAHLKAYDAPLFAIGMHFQQHAPGSLAIARLCKDLHPRSLIVLGGLTASCFHREILETYDFIDGVVRAEAEKPMVELVRGLEQTGGLTDTVNLTYRTTLGEIRTSSLMPASTDLNDFEYTRFDLLEPRSSIFAEDSCHRYSLEVCRGCIYNCAICGGSAYTYKKYLGMTKPAFRSPAKIVADMKRLNEQGIFFLGLFQDARMAGKRYWQELLSLLAREKPRWERLSLDLLMPADEEYIRAIASIGRGVVLHLCPDTGSDKVRRKLGRHYSNKEILETVKLCHQYGIPVSNFFSVGLAGETRQEMHQTWKLMEKLNDLDRQFLLQGRFADLSNRVPLGGPILGPIVLDPGSPAFDSPEKHGYKLIYRNLKEYVAGLSRPSWHQWLNYETQALDRGSIIEMILQSVEFNIDQNQANGFYGAAEAGFRRILVEMDRAIVDEVNRLMSLDDSRARDLRIISIRKNLDSFLLTRQLPTY